MNFNSDDVITYFLEVLRDCRQITFVMQNEFFPITKKKKHHLFLTDNTNTMMDRIYIYIYIYTNQNFLHCVSSFEGTSYIYIKKFLRYSHQIFYFIVVFMVFISFYISRYFSQVFRTSFNIIWRKDFCHKFSFFKGFTQPPPPTHHHSLNSQNPLSMIIFLSMLPNWSWFFKIMVLW